ncbi:MAG: FliO/MopB family protein [Phycisphaerales bacterium JB065]
MLNAFPASLVVLLIGSTAASQQAPPIRINGPVSVEPLMTVEQSDAPWPADQPLIFREGMVAIPVAETLSPGIEPASEAQSQPAAGTPIGVPTDGSVQSLELEPVEQVPETQVLNEPELEPEPEPVAASTADQATLPLPAIERTPLGTGSSPDPGTAVDSSKSSLRGIARTGGALAVVLGLILIIRFVIVKFSGVTGGLRAQLGAAGKAPSGVLFVLGRYPVSRGMSLVLLQLDQRVLLLSQTSAGFHTLAELNDPDEVASIIRKVKDDNGESLGAKFGSMLKQFERDPEIISDLEPAAESAPVRLRRPAEVEADEPDPDYTRYSGYYEEKPHTLPRTGEDELRSRINRLREYGS